MEIINNTVVIASILKDLGITDIIKDTLSLFVGDEITKRRIRNFINIYKKSALTPEKIDVLSDKFKIEFIQTASLEDNEDMQELWANLLKNTVDKGVNNSYIAILKELNHIDAKVFSKIMTFDTTDYNVAQDTPVELYIDSVINLREVLFNLDRLKLINISETSYPNRGFRNIEKEGKIIRADIRFKTNTNSGIDEYLLYRKNDLGINFYNYINK